MTLLDLHPIFGSVYCALAALPLLLLSHFLAVGRWKRRRSLISLGVANLPASGFVAAQELRDPEETFGSYLERTYSNLHHGANYLLPTLTFLLPYWLGLYWAMVAAAFLARDAGDPLWASQAGVLSASLVPAMGVLGAAASALWHLGWRIIRNDVSPRMFHHQALRI